MLFQAAGDDNHELLSYSDFELNFNRFFASKELLKINNPI